MTFSIVARDPATGDVGIAIASKALAVGAIAPFARAKVGAISTQALPNVAYGPDALARLAAGETPESILAALTAADAMAAHRQAGIVDAQGRSATWTGASCLEWAGGRAGPGVAAQGNILAGPEVVDALLDAYLAATGSFPQRLVAALQAGDRAGGDSRGRQSAALLVRREKGGNAGLDDRWIDLRVDDHTDPTAELARLLGLHDKQSNPADPENLPKIASALASGLVSALRNAVNPPEPAPTGSLTAWSPPTAAPGTTSAEPGGDAG
ncbi:MAG TPA: DUF1028 domain-containing protein [Polyangia bacterium]|jgi:uncharacterized Ntn-hydrolase superfamily protein|nr:DUF1028 domain-containing protein [Polyangia bacterium]